MRLKTAVGAKYIICANATADIIFVKALAAYSVRNPED